MRRQSSLSSGPVFRWANVIAAAVVAGSISVAHNAIAAPGSAPPAPQHVATAHSEADAVLQARQTGKPVEVLDKTTETRQILANPNGTFTLKTNVRPVRVKKNDAWTPVDTTLRSNPDGSLSAVASALDVTFSGGGTAPLIVLRHEDKSLAMSWPTPLPTPTVSGSTAIYPAILPGVDLHMTAQSDTYSQVLVVHDAPAATNPALKQIHLTAVGKGLNLTVLADGSLSASNHDGSEIFHGAPPTMWDSRLDDRTGPRPTAADLGSGRVTPLTLSGTQHTAARTPLATSTTELTLTPDAAALTVRDTVYPLYIDPSMGVRRMHYSRVTDNGWPSHYDDWGAIAQVGYCGGWEGCDGYWRARSYFQMDTTPLQPRNGLTASIWRADFYALQVWSADHNCAGGQPTTVYESGGIGPGTGWPGPAHTALDTRHSNAGGPCPANNLIFNVSSGIKRAAAGGWSSIVLGLVAANENERLQWKKFDNNPLLEVDFSFPPNNATGLKLTNEVRCDGTVITPDANPTYIATATDNNNPPLRPALSFEAMDLTESWPRPVKSGPVLIDSGTQGRWTQTSKLADGNWKFRVYVENNPGSSQNLHNPANGGNSYFYPFTVDANPPNLPSLELTADYPSGYWGAPNGAPSAIPIMSGSDSDTVGYTYAFDSPGGQRVPTPTDCNYNQTFGITGGWIPHQGEARWNYIPVPAGLPPGYHTVYIKAFDKAHNLSTEQYKRFYVAPNSGQTTQRFEAENLTRSQPPGQNLALGPQGNCCNTTWSGGAQLSFGGNASGKSFTVNFEVTTGSDYQLGVGMTSAKDYGAVDFRVDGTRLNWIYEWDMYSPLVAAGHRLLGNVPLSRGTHSLTITTTGTNWQSIGHRYLVGLDYITLTQTTRHEAESNLRFTPSQPAGQNIPIVAEVPTEPTARVECACSPEPSQDKHLRFAATAPGQSFDLNFQVPVEADYALGIGMTEWDFYGQVRISIDKTPLLRTDITPWDGYSGNGDEPYLPLGGAHLTPGAHRITFTVVGKNPASKGYQVGVDYITAVPINNVTTASFAAAMNNDGINSDGSAASLGLDLADSSLSSQTLAAAGYAPGSVVALNGANFTMPTPRPDGTDNVIAIGQTIPFPASHQVRASAVGLLVTGTCGDLPSATSTITFTDNTTKDARLPAVRDWIANPPEFADVTLPYRNEGGIPVPAHAPKLTAVFIPSDPTKTIRSITLPHYGTTLAPGSCSPALHVLAMAPRPVATGWIAAWAASADTASAPPGGTGFADQTLRTVIRPSTTGTSVRIRIANTQAPKPATIDAASLAAQATTGAATLAQPTPLTFGGGQTQVTIPAGGEVYTDPVTFPSTAGGSGNLIISLHLPTAVAAAPRQATPHQPTFLATGNLTSDSTGTPFTTRAQHFWYLSGVEVSPTNAQHGTVAVLGDTRAITAVPADGPNWVDALPAKLVTGGKPVPGGLVNLSSTDQRTTAQAINTAERTILKQPNFRTVIVTLGRDDLLNGKSSTEIKQNLTTLIHTTSPTGIRNTRRTDGSGVHVILTTIAPLDLDENSPIEQQRRQLNADILANFANYGAHEVIDLAAAVQDPAHINKTRPSYFDTGQGAPNAAYYNAIAQAVATEVTRFPPGAEL